MSKWKVRKVFINDKRGKSVDICQLFKSMVKHQQRNKQSCEQKNDISKGIREHLSKAIFNIIRKRLRPNTYFIFYCDIYSRWEQKAYTPQNHIYSKSTRHDLIEPFKLLIRKRKSKIAYLLLLWSKILLSRLLMQETPFQYPRQMFVRHQVNQCNER